MIEVLGRWGELGKRMLRSDRIAKLRARFKCKKPKGRDNGIQATCHEQVWRLSMAGEN